MSNILPVLNLNKQPTSVKDRILVDAENIRFEKDGKTITNINDIEILTVSYIKINEDGEEITEEGALIKALTYLTDTYCRTDSEIEDGVRGIITVSHILPCNNELVIFCGYHISKKIDEQTIVEVRNPIFRYNENKNLIKLNYTDYGSNVSTHNMSSTFTYNYNNELIIAFCEYGLNDDYPLKVVNLGKWEDIDNYKQISNNLLPISPIIDLPSIDLNYADGVLYKGDYTFYIRFKINDADYTQWYDLFKTFKLNTYSVKNIFDYSVLKDKGAKKISDVKLINATAFEYMSDDLELCNKSININVNNIDNSFISYQLGFVCKTKTNTITKRTDDIEIYNTSYIFNIKYLYDISEKELIKTYINYFNVKKLYNYNNKLYIGDYKENNFDAQELSCALTKEEIKIKSDSKIDYEYSAVKTTYKKLNNNNKSTLENKIVTINNITEKIVEHIDTKSDFVNLVYFIRAFGSRIFQVVDSSWSDVLDKTKSLDDIRKNDKYKVDVISRSGDFETVNTKNTKYIKQNECGVTPNGDSMDQNQYWDTNVYILRNVNIADLEIKLLGISNSLTKNTYTCELFQIRKINTHSSITGYISRGCRDSKPLDYNHLIFVKNASNLTVRESCQNKPRRYFKRYKKLIYSDGSFVLNDNIVARLSIIQNASKQNTFEQYIYRFPNNDDPVVDGNIEIITKLFTTDIENNQLSDKIKGTMTNDIKGFASNNYYGFYIHFIDKYNKMSNGYKLNIKSEDIINYSNKNIKLSEEIKKLYNINLKINPSDLNYDRFFISYNNIKNNIVRGILEMDQKTISSGAGTEIIYYLYTLDINLHDHLSINYNKIRIYDTENNVIQEDIDDNYIYFEDMYSKIKSNTYTEYTIDTISLVESDANLKYNTPCYKLVFKGPDLGKHDNDPKTYKTTRKIADIYNSEYININDNVLKLTPCSRIYSKKSDTYSDEKGNTFITVELFNGNYYNTINAAYIFADNIYFNSGNKTFNDIDNNSVPVMSSIKIGDTTETSRKKDIFLKYFFYDVQEYPYEYKQFHHAPQKLIIPGAGSDSQEPVNENFISYVPGKIFESINVIDLYKSPHLSIPESYAKVYTNYREDVVYLSECTKTIRRSNIIRDESRETSWRFFEPNQYKMISENKGKITNIVGFGDILLVHTEHSLFMFRNQYSLQSDKDEEIALQNNDIWDLKYKEVVTDQLGYAGLQDNSSYIAGQFGYIFYDSDANTIYQFDDGKFNNISTDIENYIRDSRISKINFTEDKEHNIIYCATINKVLIYDYINKAFVSKINLSKMGYYFYGFNTKQKAYFMDADYMNIATISKNTANKVTFSVIVNTSIETIKYIESIKYKLRLFNNNSVIDEGLFRKAIHPYSGEILQIQSEFCDTDNIDIAVNADAIANNYPENNCIESSTGRYDKPYFHLGQWNFNTIRDTINKNDYGQEQSRVYGDWFIITFKFNKLQTTENKKRKLEFESLTVNLIETK